MIGYGIPVFIFGLIVGSFLNVCIYRLPRGKSIVSPPSACTACGRQIKPYDNIPVLSYLLLKGKCRSCKEPLSIRYPAVELLNGILYFAAFHHFGFGWHLPFYFFFLSAMIVITFIDLEFQIIPDVISLPGIVVGLTGASFFTPDPFFYNPSVAGTAAPLGFIRTVIGAASGYVFFLLIAIVGSFLAKTDALGGGDIKLMAMVGAFTGWKGVFLTTFLGSLCGSLIGIFVMVVMKMGRKAKIPFGPFLAAGAVLSLFFGEPVIRWYLG